MSTAPALTQGETKPRVLTAPRMVWQHSFIEQALFIIYWTSIIYYVLFIEQTSAQYKHNNFLSVV